MCGSSPAGMPWPVSATPSRTGCQGPAVATETVPAVEPLKSPEEIERDWFENVYQGDRMKQLTPRALIMGMLLGAFMSTSNIYVGLKAGWSLGVAITSCILAFAIFATLHKLLPRWFPPFSILENNAMQSAASAGGYMTGAGLVIDGGYTLF